jgi:nucleoid-associated protein YgaU
MIGEVAPAPVETVAPVEDTIAAPTPVETVAPVEDTIAAPAPVETVAPVEDTIAAPAPVETVAPVEDTIAAPAPKLDTFRVENDGSAIFAGRADAMQVVAIMLDGQEIDRVIADRSGGFVVFAQLPFSDSSQALRLMADPGGVPIYSTETYLIAPIVAPVVVANDPVVAGTAIDIPTPQPLPPAAPAILVANADGVEVIQPAISDASPDVLSNVALDSITYDPSGELLIAGRAAGEGFVQVYLDNKPITTSRIVAGGGWRTDLPDVDTGVYTLRIDEVTPEGEVVSRIETPFKREEPAVVAEALAIETAQPEFQVAMTTVQPGSTLWAIARDHFGSGVMYVEVFAANRDRIRDPDLIYPGQVFRMPQTDP